MVFRTTFNNISAISWQSVLLVEETGVPGENHRPVLSHRQIVQTVPDTSKSYVRCLLHDATQVQSQIKMVICKGDTIMHDVVGNIDRSYKSNKLYINFSYLLYKT